MSIFGVRARALLSAALFVPPLVSFAVDAGARWAEYPGILFHLSLLLLVPLLNAPTWARAAGYSWLAIDVLAGALLINNVSHDIADPVRLGGHILGGLWVAVASFHSTSLAIRVVGMVGGLWLGGYTFVATIAPEGALAPAGILITIWLILLAVIGVPQRASPGGVCVCATD